MFRGWVLLLLRTNLDLKLHVVEKEIWISWNKNNLQVFVETGLINLNECQSFSFTCKSMVLKEEKKI